MYERVSKYKHIFIVPFLTIVSLIFHGFWVWALPFVVYVVVPLIETFATQSEENLTKEQEKEALQDKFYDWLLYIMVPLQYFILFLALFLIANPMGFYTEFFLDSEPDALFSGKIWFNVGAPWTTLELLAKLFTLGIYLGMMGINLGHELGHRVTTHERFMAKALLLSTLYMHFFIEHNRGHHKYVATDDDPASSRRGEILYFFWIRTIIFSYLSAWKLENERLRKAGLSVMSLQNEMIRFQLIQIAFVALIYLLFGTYVTAFYLIASLIGILHLETVNYVEHYGLRRKKTASGNYERVLPIHSWNSNHPTGRTFLFELTRHSDHHYMASRKYQILRHFDESPQMPFGYPAMMAISTIPPLWFYIMHKRIDEYRERLPEGTSLA